MNNDTINNKFLYYRTWEAFRDDQERISPNSIVFIEKGEAPLEETKRYIYTHGQFYDCTPHTGPVQTKKTVMVGHGADYNSAVFTDTNKQLQNNTIVTITNEDGDFIFLKIDEQDTLNNFKTYPGEGQGDNLYYDVPIDLMSTQDGYKIYKSTILFEAGTVDYMINKQ